MPEFRTQDAIEALRAEQREAFAEINAKLEAHHESHLEIESRLTTVEDHKNIVTAFVGGLYLAALAALGAWLNRSA